MKNHTVKFLISAAFLLLLPFLLCGKDVFLLKDGKAVSVIRTNKNASDLERHAANELSLFLGKLSGGDAPKVLEKGKSSSLYPVSFALVKEDGEIREDGFRIKVTEKETVISAKDERGLLYGAYEILKRYGKIRFLIPGEDGTYFQPKKTLALPVSDTVYNPSFRFRTFFFESCNVNSPIKATYDWMLRNNMYIEVSPLQYNNKAISALLKPRAANLRGTIHSFSGLLTLDPSTCHVSKEIVRRLVKEKPHLFPLVDGKRKLDFTTSGGDRAQPCTSNEETIQIMGGNLLALYKKYGSLEHFCCMLGNNDGTIWCECDSCKAQDGKGDSYNYPANRYWTFVNRLSGMVYKEFPNADVRGWAYQNFHSPPKTVTPDKRLSIQLAFNRRCNRHTLTDPNCPINKVFLKHFQDWSKYSNPKFTWEQFNHSGANYMPMENTFVEDLYTYKKLGVNGCMLAGQPPDGIYGKRYANTNVPNVWRSMWQTLYLSASILWDVNTDKNALLEEINSLYYGKAWEGGMKEFRTLLDQAARTTPGCFGHGLNGPVGRCLDHPGVHEKLLKALEKAKKAAEGDERSLAHVKMDEKIFKKTWEAKRKEYLENHRDYTAFPRTAPIEIDGVLKEADWKKAGIITNFQNSKGEAVKQQTFARLVYEKDFLYLGADLMEPAPEKMKKTPADPEKIWWGNTLEFFLHQPELGGEYLHLTFSPAGTAYASFRDLAGKLVRKVPLDNLKWKTVQGKDRWTVECRIPASMVGMNFSKGSTWKLNIGRTRYAQGEKAQASSICRGVFQGSGVFQPLLLTEERVVTSSGERIASFWKNPSLNVTAKVHKRSPWKKWELQDGLIPASWFPAGKEPGKLVFVMKDDGSKDAYIRFTGTVSQGYADKSANTVRVRIRVRAAGKGKMNLGIPRYNLGPKGNWKFCGPDGKNLKGKNPVELSEEFKEYSWEYTKRANEFFALSITSSPDGFVQLDEAVITPIQ